MTDPASAARIAALESTELERLYRTLLSRPECLAEFKTLLSRYAKSLEPETGASAAIRAELDAKLADWIGAPFRGLTIADVRLWQAIVLDERLGDASQPQRSHR